MKPPQAELEEVRSLEIPLRLTQVERQRGDLITTLNSTVISKDGGNNTNESCLALLSSSHLVKALPYGKSHSAAFISVPEEKRKDQSKAVAAVQTEGLLINWPWAHHNVQSG